MDPRETSLIILTSHRRFRGSSPRFVRAVHRAHDLELVLHVLAYPVSTCDSSSHSFISFFRSLL